MKALQLRGLGYYALGSVTDIVKLGGRTYSINQLLDKVLVASGPIRVYDRPGGKVMYTVGSGQSVGKIYSFNRPSATNGGQFWLQFDHPTAKWPNGVPKAAWITSDSYVDTRTLETQGTQTLKQQMDAEKEKAEKKEDPILYYVKKVGVPLALGAGVVYLAATYGKELIKSKLTQPALNGPGGQGWWIGGGLLVLAAGAWYWASKENAPAQQALTQMVQQPESTVPLQKIEIPQRTKIPGSPIVLTTPPPQDPYDEARYSDVVVNKAPAELVRPLIETSDTGAIVNARPFMPDTETIRYRADEYNTFPQAMAGLLRN